MSNILIYLTNTLRIEYNELFENITENDNVTILYIFNKRHIDDISNLRKKFLYEAVKNFENDLNENNIYLHKEYGDPKEILKTYMENYSYDKIITEKQFAYDEIEVNRYLKEISQEKKVQFNQISTQTILNSLPFELNEIPNTYTNFRKIVEKNDCYNINLPNKELPKFNSVKQENKLTDNFEIEDEINLRYYPNRENALNHLNNYIWKRELIKTYKNTRNQMLGEDYSTKFSPYLALGILNVKEIILEVNQYEKTRIKNISTYWVKFELLWREYCKWVSLKYEEKVFLSTGIQNKEIFSKTDNELYDKFIKAQTGYGLIDAAIRELTQTGYMSNRARQNVASFFVKNLHQPWLKGAKFFEDYLLDYDPCSNYLNWQYVAGCGNDSREFRYFNIYKQTKDYDPKHEYIKYYVPEFETSDYPKEIVDFYETINTSKQNQ